MTGDSPAARAGWRFRSRWTPAALILWIGACILPCAAEGDELVVNGSLEQMVHNFPAGWERTEDSSGRVTATWTIEEGVDSAKALKIDCTAISPALATPDASPVHVMQRGIALTAGQKYTLSFKAKGTRIADKAFSVQIMDTGTPASPPVFEAVVALTAGWKEYRFEFAPSADIPPKNSLLRFALISTGTLWLDDVSLQGDPGVATDKTIVPKFQNRLPRLGTTNLVPNASFECGSDGWLSLGQRLGFGGNIAGLYGKVEFGEGPHGPHVFRVTLGPGVTPESYFDCFPPQHIVQRRLLTANRGWIEVEPGRVYTLSAFMRSDIPGTQAVLQFNFNGDARKEVQLLAKEVVLTEEWQRYSYTVVAPEDGVYVAVGPDISNGPVSAATTFWADAIQLEAGEEATPFAPREAVELGFNANRYGNVFA
ncbi:MAG: carbohydrate binding domain-containing protein, partial [Planctomycetota bacterium]